MTKDNKRFRFSIDRGGTFTDIYCEVSDGIDTKKIVLKLLSEDPSNYGFLINNYYYYSYNSDSYNNY